MQNLQFRFTVRRLMIAVAITGAILFCYRTANYIILILLNNDNVFHSVNTPVHKSWDLGLSPSVAVDLFDGWITVVPSNDDKVTADIETGASTKSSQAAADKALKTIDLRFHRWKNTLKISLNGMSNLGLNYSNNIKIYVPNGVYLDLRTGRGNIYVGRDYRNGKWTHTPISASSIRAKNDSEYQLGNAQGSIVVEALASPETPARSSSPTLIRLDAPGRIDIIADFAVVEANAWHGNPPKQWPQGIYESEDEGTIRFEGSLAKGIHLLRASHRINMRLRGASSLQIEAEAIAGQITGNILPGQVDPTEGTARWVGSLGAEGGGVLHLLTNDGPISLRTD